MTANERKERHLLKPVMTLEQIADVMGCTRERVRQLEESALRNARKILRKKGYNPDHFFSDPKYTKPIKHNPDAPESEFELIEPERKEDD
jgi:hypothetical protein